MNNITIVKGGRDGRPAAERGATFSGSVWGDTVLPETDQITINNVHFQPGGRTYWHTHGLGQVLVVTAGEGFVFDRTGFGARIRTGDIVHIPGGTEHWHGATRDSFMTHIAISVQGHDWLDEVADSEYESAHELL